MTPQEVPHSIESEQALLGAIMLNNDAFDRVSDIVRPEHFYEALHRDIFDLMARAAAARKKISPVTLAPHLPEQVLENLTMAQYLAQIVSGATTIVNAPDFAASIRDKYVLRQVIEISQITDQSARNLAIDAQPKSVIEDAEKRLYELAESGRMGAQVMQFNEAMVEAINQAAAAYQRDGSLTGVATGLIDLDRLMGGLQRSDLIILAARPGMGKTSMATNIAFNAANSFMGEVDEQGVTHAKNGARVLFYSLEMSAEQLATRILSEQARIPSSAIRRGDIHESQYGTLVDTAQRLSAIPLSIDDTGGQNIAQIASSARRQKRANGLDLIVVDYIQLISGTTRRSGENRVQEITEITTKLKALAKELDVPVVALSQLSRNVENREDKRPQLSDLRESGSIEQDADVVLFIYREEYYLRFKEPDEGTEQHLEWQAEMEKASGRADALVSKQRHGPTGTVQLHFDANLTRFSNLAREDYFPERTA